MAFVAIERLIREVRPFRCDCVCVGAYGMRMCCLRLLWRAQAASPWRTTPRLVVAAVVFGAWSEFERSGWGLVGAETGCAGALCWCRVVLCVDVVWCQTEAPPGRQDDGRVLLQLLQGGGQGYAQGVRQNGRLHSPVVQGRADLRVPGPERGGGGHVPAGHGVAHRRAVVCRRCS